MTEKDTPYCFGNIPPEDRNGLESSLRDMIDSITSSSIVSADKRKTPIEKINQDLDFMNYK